MRKYFLLVFATILFVGFSIPMNANAAIADGTYSISYQVNKPGSSSASIANDYFLKPAKLIVNNGKMTMQLTIKNSAWVTEFNPPGGAKVISSNDAADQRVVQFSVSNANLVTIAMKVDIEDIDYHHGYSVDFVFNSSSLPEAKVEEPKTETKPETKSESKPTTPAPTQPKESSGSNTSSNKPATSTVQQTTKPSTEQSTPAVISEEKANEEDKDATVSTEIEQAEESEVVENPETSDELPIIALLLLVVASIVFIRTKQTKTME